MSPGQLGNPIGKRKGPTLVFMKTWRSRYMIRPRACVRASHADRMDWHVVNQCQLGNPVGHREGFTLVPMPSRRHFWCGRHRVHHAFARRPLSEWIDMWQTMPSWSYSRSSRRFLLWFPREYGVRVWAIQGSPRASACARRTQTQID